MKVQQAAGEARNDPDQKAEGKGLELRGKVQKLVGGVKGASGDKVGRYLPTSIG